MKGKATFAVPNKSEPFFRESASAHVGGNGCGGCGGSRATTTIATDHMGRLRHALDNPEPYPSDDGGDGILYVGGGKYWPGIVVGIRLLRAMGCNLPVEVWHRGCEEVFPGDVKGLGDVEFHNIDQVSLRNGNDNRIANLIGEHSWRGGWEAKYYAFTHTAFDRFVFLDADAYPVAAPCSLFDELRGRGIAYWSDLPHTWGNTKWRHILPELEQVGNATPPVQGGHLVIDREKAWPALWAAHHICQHSDYYWQAPGDPNRRLMFGDQDALRVAIAAGASSYRHIGPAEWRSTAFVCHVGLKPVIVHRCQSKLFQPRDQHTPGDGRANYSLPLEAIVWEHYADVVNKRPRPAPEVFADIYRTKHWGDGSGVGSSEAEVKPFAEWFNAWFKSKGYTSLVDLGCGDGRTASQLDVGEYIGVDCVPDSARLSSQGVLKGAIILDAYKDVDSIPSGDVLLIKDVLHHWPSAMIREFLACLVGMRRSGSWSAILLVNDCHQRGGPQDCILGGYRALAPTMSPLNEFSHAVEFSYLHKTVISL